MKRCDWAMDGNAGVRAFPASAPNALATGRIYLIRTTSTRRFTAALGEVPASGLSNP